LPHDSAGAAARRRALPRLARLGLLVWLLAAAPAAMAQPSADLASIAVQRVDGALTLDFSVRLRLSRTVEEALQRGVPVYFVAEAELYRSRWYWRDDRIARATRTWRLAYQPLTATWRVGVGAITRSHATLDDALAAIARSSGWKLADAATLDADSRHYVEFEFRLDQSQLPGPMQIGLTGNTDWALRVARSIRVD
jgi:hypothetical protein